MLRWRVQASEVFGVRLHMVEGRGFKVEMREEYPWDSWCPPPGIHSVCKLGSAMQSRKMTSRCLGIAV